MSNKQADIIEILGTALSFVQVGAPVAREVWLVIQVAQKLYARVLAGEEITVEEIVETRHKLNIAGEDLLNTD